MAIISLTLEEYESILDRLDALEEKSDNQENGTNSSEDGSDVELELV